MITGKKETKVTVDEVKTMMDTQIIQKLRIEELEAENEELRKRISDLEKYNDQILCACHDHEQNIIKAKETLQLFASEKDLDIIQQYLGKK